MEQPIDKSDHAGADKDNDKLFAVTEEIDAGTEIEQGGRIVAEQENERGIDHQGSAGKQEASAAPNWLFLRVLEAAEAAH